MSIDLTFNGSTCCHGDPGWFDLDTIWLSQYDDRLWVKCYPKRTPPRAPIIFEFTNPEDLRTLICGLAKALTQMTQLPKKEDAHVQD